MSNSILEEVYLFIHRHYTPANLLLHYPELNPVFFLGPS